MMTGEQLGVGHEPRHGTAYVSSWIKALENDRKETRAAAVDAPRISDLAAGHANGSGHSSARWIETGAGGGQEPAEPARAGIQDRLDIAPAMP